MAYDVANPPKLMSGPLFSSLVGLGGRIWWYSSPDAVTLVRVSNYFTNGFALGMRHGDLCVVCDNDAAPLAGAICWVNIVTGTTIDLSDGVAITNTNTD